MGDVPGPSSEDKKAQAAAIGKPDPGLQYLREVTLTSEEQQELETTARSNVPGTRYGLMPKLRNRSAVTATSLEVERDFGPSTSVYPRGVYPLSTWCVITVVSYAATAKMVWSFLPKNARFQQYIAIQLPTPGSVTLFMIMSQY